MSLALKGTTFELRKAFYFAPTEEIKREFSETKIPYPKETISDGEEMFRYCCSVACKF